MVLTLNELVLWVLIGTFLLIFGFAMLSRFLQYREEKLLERERTECRLCGYVYRSNSHEVLSKCGLCGGVNRSRGNGKLG
jgi:hypothetical protein